MVPEGLKSPRAVLKELIMNVDSPNNWLMMWEFPEVVTYLKGEIIVQEIVAEEKNFANLDYIHIL